MQRPERRQNLSTILERSRTSKIRVNDQRLEIGNQKLEELKSFIEFFI